MHPLRKWTATGHPKDDLSWLAFGYDLEAHAYPGIPYSYGFVFEDGGKMVANATRLIAIIDGITEGPDIANKAVEVIKGCLTCVTQGQFPATPMIAHRWMVNRDFVKSQQWAVPRYCKDKITGVVYKYDQPGIDSLAGAEQILEYMDVIKPVDLLRPLPVHAVSMQRLTTREKNMQMIRASGFARIPEGTVKFPNGLVLFWQSEIMDELIMSMKNMPKFEDDELACCPMSGTPWYVVYISAYAE